MVLLLNSCKEFDASVALFLLLLEGEGLGVQLLD